MTLWELTGFIIVVVIQYCLSLLFASLSLSSCRYLFFVFGHDAVIVEDSEKGFMQII